MSNQPSKLGQYIKKYRKKHNLRQKDLAKLSQHTKCSFSQPFVWSIESGYRKRIHSLSILKSLSNILNLPVNIIYKLNGFPIHFSDEQNKRSLAIGKGLEKTGLSTQQIANKLNISIATVDSWLRGKLPAFETDILLASRLHINIGIFDSSAANKIHKLFNASGTKKFKLLRLLNGWSLHQVFLLTGLKKNRSLIDVEAGKSYNFNIIYHLANLYHIHIREITNHKFSLSSIYKVSHTTGNRLLIVRHLKEFTLNQLSQTLNHELSLSNLSKAEHDLRPITIQLISGLSRTYEISFKVMLNFLDYRITGISPGKRRKQNGIELKILRNKYKLSLSQVSEKTNYKVNRSALSSCENGNRNVNINTLPYLANVYHIQLKDLLAKLRLKIQLNNKRADFSVLNKYKV